MTHVILTSSYFAISSSMGAGGGADAGAGAAAGAGEDTGAILGEEVALLTGSCDEDACFDGEPGLGGRDGWIGEFAMPVTGRGAARVPGAGSERVVDSGRVGPVDSVDETTMAGGGLSTGGFGGAAVLLLAIATILSNFCFRNPIRASSCLTFLTKSLTSPGLETREYQCASPNECKKGHSLEWVLQIFKVLVSHIPNFCQSLCA